VLGVWRGETLLKGGSVLGASLITALGSMQLELTGHCALHDLREGRGQDKINKPSLIVEARLLKPRDWS
jgi:hypothetical protein